MILLIYTIFTVIAGSDGDSSDDDETQTIDINALNAEILNEDDEIQQMQNGTIDDVIAMETSTILGKSTPGLGHWGHVSALISSKLAEQPNPYYLSPEAATLKKR